MFTKQQDFLLAKFADLSDRLFDLGITTTDNFTGEIGEYIVCKHFKLNKSRRSTRAVDGVCVLGNRYQVKAKVVLNRKFTFKIGKLESEAFDFLAVVYFDEQYNPIKILRIRSNEITGGAITITSSLMGSGIENIDKPQIKIPSVERKAINDFANAYNELKKTGIIRSRRIVGDIGEFYACKRLGLEISENKNEKGIDARHKNGLTFEIKTRRVYESGRRLSETRRLNNLLGKSADYLIVVALDRKFKCAGMWLIPMRNLTNPQSAHLKIVNTTSGTKNLIQSKISWLNTGEIFSGFPFQKKVYARPTSNDRIIKPKKTMRKDEEIRQYSPIKNSPDRSSTSSFLGCLGWGVIIFVIFYLLS